jgi:hypothetical protein
LVTLVRQAETPWLALGEPVLPLAWAAHAGMPGATQRSEEQRARLGTQLTAALEAQHRSAHQSRRLPQGKAVPHGTSVNADDPTMAPMCQGQSHGPAQLAASPA